MAEASPQQLKEYEKQLSEIEQLLQASPEDASLLSLKSDLVELVTLTRESLSGINSNENVTSPPVEKTAVVNHIIQEAPIASSAITGTEDPIRSSTEAEASAPVFDEPPTKKPKRVKEFEIPQRLVILETDSEKEIKRKKRAVKELKRQHRAVVKEVESEKKQKSWQSFQKKKKLGKDSSIFSTHDGESKIGVTSGRRKTAFNERARHK